MTNIKFKIKANNRLLYMEYGTEKKFRSVCFDTEVEDKDVNGKIVRQVFVNLARMKSEGTDPTKQKGTIDTQDYELLGEPENIGVEFTIKGLTRENIEDDVLILTRQDYYIIEVHKETTPELNDEWKPEIALIESLEPKDGNSDFDELNRIIRDFSEKGVKNIHIWKLKNLVWGQCWSDKPLGELQDKVNDVLKTATGSEIDWLSNINNKKLYEVDSYAKRVNEHPGEAGWFEYIIGSKYYDHIKARKNATKHFSEQLDNAINAARRMVPEVEKIIDDWRKAGGLTDQEYNAKVEEFDQEKQDIQASFDKLKKEITNGKHEQFSTEFTQEINKVVDDISASEDLGTPTKIASDEINLFTATNKQAKLDKKTELRKLLKILNRKREVVEEFEEKIKGVGGEKYNCIQCGQEKDKTVNPPIDGKYCSDKCKDEANKGNNKYNCAKCGKENTDTPIIKDGKKYCSICSKEEPKKNNDDQKDKNPSQSKTKAIQEINTALSQDPKVLTSELDSDYRNWENQIKQFNKTEDINILKDLVLKNIEKIRKEKKEAAKIDSDLETLKAKKGEELKKSLKDMINEHDGKKHWEDKKVLLAKEEDRLFQEDPEKLKDLVKEVVNDKMTKCGVSEGELGTEEKKIFTDLKNKKIGDKKQLQEGKDKLIKFIGNKEIEKKVKDLKKQVETASNSSARNSIKNKLLSLLAEDNIYVNNYKKEINQLFEKLEKDASNTTKNPSSSIPWKIVLPIGLVVGIGIIGFVLWKRKKNIELE